MILGYFRQPRLPGRVSLRQRVAVAWLVLAAIGTTGSRPSRGSQRQQSSRRKRSSSKGFIVNIVAMDSAESRSRRAGTVTRQPAGLPPSPGIVHLSGCQPARFGLWDEELADPHPQHGGNSIPLAGPAGDD